VEPYYLSLGKAVHAALAVYHDPESKFVTEVDPLEFYGDLAVRQYYDEAGLDPDTTTEEEDEQAEYVGKLTRAYIEHDRENPSDFNVLRVEDEFKAVLGEVCWKCGAPYPKTSPPNPACLECGATIYILVGRLDIVGIRDKHLVQLDHKTVKSFSDDSTAAFAHSFQQIGYCYGYGNRRCKCRNANRDD